MPFTGSHPAAVLPFARWLPFPALAIGSMSPDAYYYLPLPVPTTLTHSLLGVLTVDLASGLVAYAVWVTLFWPWLLALWPALAARAVDAAQVAGSAGASSTAGASGVADAVGHVAGPGSPARRPSPRVPASVSVPIALIVGGLTHVVWDAFTHPDRWGTHHLAVLTTRYGSLEVYRWAQYASGLFGALALLVAAVVWWRRQGRAVAGASPRASAIASPAAAGPAAPPAAAPPSAAGPAVAPPSTAPPSAAPARPSPQPALGHAGDAGPGAVGPVAAIAVAAVAGFGAAGWTLLVSHGGLREAVFQGATRGGGAGAAAVLVAAVIWRVSGRPGHPGATAAS